MRFGIVENGTTRIFRSAEFVALCEEVREKLDTPSVNWTSQAALAVIEKFKEVCKVDPSHYPYLIQAAAAGNFDIIPESLMKDFFQPRCYGSVKNPKEIRYRQYDPEIAEKFCDLKPEDCGILYQPSSRGFIPSSINQPFRVSLEVIPKNETALIGIWSLCGSFSTRRHHGLLAAIPKEKETEVFFPGPMGIADEPGSLKLQHFDLSLRSVTGMRRRVGYHLYKVSDCGKSNRIIKALGCAELLTGRLEILKAVSPEKRWEALVALLVDAGPLRRRALLRDLRTATDAVQDSPAHAIDIQDALAQISDAVNKVHCRYSALVTNCRYMDRRVLRVFDDLIGLSQTAEKPDFSEIFPQTHFGPDSEARFRQSCIWRILLWLVDAIAFLADLFRDLFTRRAFHIARAARASDSLASVLNPTVNSNSDLGI